MAEQFEFEFVEFEEGSDTFEAMMREKGSVCDKITEEYKLLPTIVEEVGTWGYADSVLRCAGLR